MSFPVYDYRTDIRNVLVTPQIRSRFLRIEPGPMGEAHSHDLGHEVFLVLEGEAEFEIDGDRGAVRPGQMCVALIDQMHAVRAVGPEPVSLYLSVTPHIQPTHTMWDEHGNRRPERFVSAAEYDTNIDRSLPDRQVVDSYVAALSATAEAARNAAAEGADAALALKTAMDQGDRAGIEEARRILWSLTSRVYEHAAEMADIWNDLAARTAEAQRQNG